MANILHVPSFGGGVVKFGSPDTQRTNELQLADSYDIAERGQLVVASDTTPFVDAKTSGAGAVLSPVYAIEILSAPQSPQIVCVGSAFGETYISFVGVNGASPGGASKGATPAAGVIVTTAPFPIVDATGAQLRLMLVAIAARSASDPRQGLGLFAVTYNSSGPSYGSLGIDQYDALGTGPLGSFPGGTNAKMLYPRGVLAYNSHALLYGFDDHDATSGDGPNRVMISNTGNPLKYGFDPLAAAIVDGAPEEDRAFEDQDAVVVGGAGEAIRAGVVWAGKAWFGTSRGLHYIEGFGRESFLTNGVITIRKSKNVIGAHAFIEGPDGLLHGIGDEGHWIFDGAETAPVGDRLRDLDGASNGYWDLIWTTDTVSLDAFPGRTNSDLVWMMTDATMKQVLIGIPFCDAAHGKGRGDDTVVLKYHTKTGGYTRQVFSGKVILSAVEFRREQTAAGQTFMAMGNAMAGTNVVKYRERSSLLETPVMPTALPDAWHGEYAPHGPNGVGVSRKVYLTVSWVSALSLPIAFEVTPVVDQAPVADPVRLTIGDAPGPNLVVGPDTLHTLPWEPVAGAVVAERSAAFAGRFFNRITNPANAGAVIQYFTAVDAGIYTLSFDIRHNGQVGRDIHELYESGLGDVALVRSVYNADGTITFVRLAGQLTVIPLVDQAYHVMCASIPIPAGRRIGLFASNISGAGYVDGVTSRYSARWSATPPPRDGDLWLDTSGTDKNLGLGTSSAMVAGRPNAYILRRYVASSAGWESIGYGGVEGLRASIPIAFTPMKGTRLLHRIRCLSANGRFQIEGLGLEPATIRSNR